MIRRLMLLPLSIAIMSAAPVKESPAAAMLLKLGELQGKWAGEYSWSGARQGGGPIAAQYGMAKFKGSVTEELIMDGTPYMTSVYHLDGADLRVTHFCVQSQPRLKADKMDSAAGSAHFALVDVTNAGPTNYVEAIGIERPAPDHLTIRFTFKGEGSSSVETVNLHRIA